MDFAHTVSLVCHDAGGDRGVADTDGEHLAPVEVAPEHRLVFVGQQQEVEVACPVVPFQPDVGRPGAGGERGTLAGRDVVPHEPLGQPFAADDGFLHALGVETARPEQGVGREAHFGPEPGRASRHAPSRRRVEQPAPQPLPDVTGMDKEAVDVAPRIGGHHAGGASRGPVAGKEEKEVAVEQFVPALWRDALQPGVELACRVVAAAESRDARAEHGVERVAVGGAGREEAEKRVGVRHVSGGEVSRWKRTPDVRAGAAGIPGTRGARLSPRSAGRKQAVEARREVVETIAKAEHQVVGLVEIAEVISYVQERTVCQVDFERQDLVEVTHVAPDRQHVVADAGPEREPRHHVFRPSRQAQRELMAQGHVGHKEDALAVGVEADPVARGVIYGVERHAHAEAVAQVAHRGEAKPRHGILRGQDIFVPVAHVAPLAPRAERHEVVAPMAGEGRHAGRRRRGVGGKVARAEKVGQSYACPERVEPRVGDGRPSVREVGEGGAEADVEPGCGRPTQFQACVEVGIEA